MVTSSQRGHHTSTVYANTTATQMNHLWVDPHQDVYAGIGGNGGDANVPEGGIDLLSVPLA
jgi:hypothetical protein